MSKLRMIVIEQVRKLEAEAGGLLELAGKLRRALAEADPKASPYAKAGLVAQDPYEMPFNDLLLWCDAEGCGNTKTGKVPGACGKTTGGAGVYYRTCPGTMQTEPIAKLPCPQLAPKHVAQFNCSECGHHNSHHRQGLCHFQDKQGLCQCACND